jgi:hypothetical protein
VSGLRGFFAKSLVIRRRSNALACLEQLPAPLLGREFFFATALAAWLRHEARRFLLRQKRFRPCPQRCFIYADKIANAAAALSPSAIWGAKKFSRLNAAPPRLVRDIGRLKVRVCMDKDCRPHPPVRF